MTNFELALDAYLSEHASISSDEYETLHSIFMEYRDPKGESELDASLSALEQRKELEVKMPKFSASLNEFYNKTLVEETEKELKKKVKDPIKLKTALIKCRKTLKEQSGLFQNAIYTAVVGLPGLPQKYGEQIVDIVTNTSKYDIKTHKQVIAVCKKCMTIKDQIKTSAKQFVSAAKSVAETILAGASMIAIATALIVSSGALASMPSETIVGDKPETMTQEEYDKKLDDTETGKGLAALVAGGVPIGASVAMVNKGANAIKQHGEDIKRRKVNGTLKKARA